jgi:hypothetical protein
MTDDRVHGIHVSSDRICDGVLNGGSEGGGQDKNLLKSSIAGIIRRQGVHTSLKAWSSRSFSPQTAFWTVFALTEVLSLCIIWGFLELAGLKWGGGEEKFL